MSRHTRCCMQGVPGMEQPLEADDSGFPDIENWSAGDMKAMAAEMRAAGMADGGDDNQMSMLKLLETGNIDMMKEVFKEANPVPSKTDSKVLDQIIKLCGTSQRGRDALELWKVRAQ